MKNLISVIILISLLACFKSVYAQFSIGADIGAQIPTSTTFKNFINTGYGATLSGEYKIPFIPIAVSLSASYDNWPYKSMILYSVSNSGVHQETFSGINMYSFNFYVGPMLYINIPVIGLSSYVGGAFGLMAATSTVQGASYGNGIIYSPFLGFRYTLPSRIISLDLNAKEEYYKQNDESNILSWFGINAGVYISI